MLYYLSLLEYYIIVYSLLIWSKILLMLEVKLISAFMDFFFSITSNQLALKKKTLLILLVNIFPV